jgi:hypothetical protein
LPFGCNDLVVVGTIENGPSDPVQSQDDILGHGWTSATLKVRKVIKGPRIPAVLPVRYFSHALMREDVEFMLVLKRAGAGYEIATGQRMALRPRLASRCEEFSGFKPGGWP